MPAHRICRRAARNTVLGAVTAIALVIIPGCGDSDEPSTVAAGQSGQETSTQSTDSGTTGGGTTGGGDSRDDQSTGTGRSARPQEQGRLGAQPGGSPVQGGSRGAARRGVATIVLSGGGPVGGVQRIRFGKGKRVSLIVRSNTDEVVLIPGYRLRKKVRAGGSARFRFKTTKVGLFSIDLVRGQARIGVLQVG